MAKKLKKSKKSSDIESTLDEQLDEMFDDSWEDIDPVSFEDVPDDNYVTRILAAVLNNSKQSGRLQCSWEFLILQGDYAGRHVYKHAGLDTEEARGYFKGDLARLGYDQEVKSKEELLELLEEIIEAPTYVMIKVVTTKKKVDGEKREYRNVRIGRVLEPDEVEDEFLEDEISDDSQEEEWGKGDKVLVDIDGTDYPGKIKKLNKGEAHVLFEDGDSGDYPLEELKAPEEEPEEELEEFKKGDRVEADIDGTAYPGKVTKIKGDQISITFDDGDKDIFDASDVTKLEEEEEEEEEEKGEEEGCSLINTKVSVKNKKAILKLAKVDKFDPDDFDTMADLLCEIGDYNGLEGKYKTVGALIKAINKKTKE